MTKTASSPNPNWKPGDKINSPVTTWKSIDPQQVDVRERYGLLVATVIPRPIALLSTIGASNVPNLAPASAFNLVSSDPVSVMFAIARNRDGSKKDTIRNVEETGEFVVNTVSDWMIEPVVQTSFEYAYEVDEMEKVGLTPMASEKVRPARVRESAVQMECRVLKIVETGDGSAGSASVVIGEVVMFHIAEAAYRDGHVDLTKLNPISRLGGASYGRVGEIFDIPRPKNG